MAATRILVTGARGGVGKSSVTAHLAAAFAREGKPTLVLDLCTATRSLDLLFSLSEETVYDFGDLLSCRVAPERTIIAVPGIDRLSFLPGMFRPRRMPTAPELIRSLSSAEEASGCEVLLIDGAWDELTLRTAPLVQTVIVVSDCRRASLRAAENTAAALPDGPAVFLLLNRVPLSEEHPLGVGIPGDLCSVLDSIHLPLLGIVPEESTLPLIDEEGQAVLPCRGNLSLAYRNIACRLGGSHAPLLTGFRGVKRHRLLRQMIY